MADWFKFYEDGINCDKMRYMMHENDKALTVWIWVLSQCCKKKSDTFGASKYDLAGASMNLNTPKDEIRNCLLLLDEVGYIQVDGDDVKVLKWSKLQSEYCKRLQDGSSPTSKKVKLTSKKVQTEEKRREEKRREETKKMSVVFPPVLDNKDFREKWKYWLEYRSEIKKSYKSVKSEQAQLNALSKHGAAIAIEAIENSVSAGWTGLFPDKVGTKKTSGFVSRIK